MNTELRRIFIRLVLPMAGIAALFLVWGTGSALASGVDRITELEWRLAAQGRLIEKLTERIRELEKRSSQEQGAPAPVAAAAPSPAAETVTAATPSPAAETVASAPAAAPSPKAETVASAQASAGVDPGFFDEVTWLHGFADVGLNYSGKRPEDGQRRKGFSVGALDFYLTPQLGSHVKSLAELIFEVNREGETEAELERLQIGYSFNDHLTLWAGRYHTPIGYWNTAFHHGKQIQTSILRPKFLDFEEDGGIIPTHMVGVWGSGGARLGGGRVNYDLYVANGPKITGVSAGGDGRLNANPFSDDNYNLVVGLNVGYDFAGALDGLRLGVHALRAEVDGYDPQELRLSRSRLNLLGGYGVYTSDDWEVIGELYQFLNKDLSGGSGSHSSTLGFLQAGRLFGSFTPYARLEFASLDQRDNYFSRLREGQSYRRGLAGIRYDLTPKAALKLEGNHTRIMNRERDDFFEINSQFAIRF